MKKVIDLDEIIKSYETFVTISQPHNTEPIFLKENVRNICMEFGKQLLELAAENAKIIEIYNAKDNGFNAAWEKVIELQSITDTINQVKS